MPTSSGFQLNEVLTSANTNTYLLRPNRNAIINGSMVIAQRGALQAGITSYGYYCVDRWAVDMISAGTWTQSQTAIASGDAPAAEGFQSSSKMLCTAATSPAAGSALLFQHRIEGYNLAQFGKGNGAAKPFALSFWVRSNKVGTYVAELYDYTNGRSVSSTYTITSSGVWQKVRIIFPADVIAPFANSPALALQVAFWLMAGSNFTAGSLQTTWGAAVSNKRASGVVNLADAVNNYWEVTGVQLEPNSVCTPFEHEDVMVLYAKCWRYFQRHLQPALRGVVSGGLFNRLAFSYPPMRTTPTGASNGGTVGFYNGTTSVPASVAFTFAYSVGANSTFEADISSAGWGADGRVAAFYQFSGATFALDLSAEL